MLNLPFLVCPQIHEFMHGVYLEKDDDTLTLVVECATVPDAKILCELLNYLAPRPICREVLFNEIKLLRAKCNADRTTDAA